MRFRITVRGDEDDGRGIELRGFIDVLDMDELVTFSQVMKPYGLVIASPGDDGFTEAWAWRL